MHPHTHHHKKLSYGQYRQKNLVCWWPLVTAAVPAAVPKPPPRIGVGAKKTQVTTKKTQVTTKTRDQNKNQRSKPCS
jgi:hypothetical protein